MADDKGGGGGGTKWEPFEIVVIIILAIGLLTNLKQGPETTTPAPKPAVVSKAPEPDACGLSISRPHSLEKVTSFVTLIGSTDGCTWTSTPSVALYAQVIDSRGKPVSAYTTVPVVSSGVGTAYFDTTIPLNDTPVSGTGYLILIPAKSSGYESITSRIPLKF